MRLIGAFNDGLNQGRQSGRNQGQRAGSNSNTDENRFKETAKASAKGAAGGAAEGAAKGAVKGAAKEGVKGVKDGAKTGAQLGSKVPYAGVVLGPLGGVVGGAVGGALGTTKGAVGGAVGGALGGAAEGAKEGAVETGRKRLKDKARKGLGSLKDNIKGAMKGNIKDIYMLKIKGAIFLALAVLVFFALIVEEVAESTSKAVFTSANTTFENGTTDSANLFNTTGSLLMATDEELKQVKDSFMGEIENTNESYYNALNVKYSGKKGSSVANKVQHITTNYDAGTTEEVAKITNNVTAISGAASLADDRTIFEHIIRAEKYNFNNIIWRSYVKSGSGVTAANMSFQVDSQSKLKYPISDANDTDNASHDLNFFITKTRSYLQSWYIPLDLTVGTMDQFEENLNTKLAYEIMASAYHEIVLDRYKIETLVRTTNYRVYDKTTTTTTTTRSCADYNIKVDTEVAKKAGSACTAEEYNQGLCKDSVMKYKKTVCGSNGRNCREREINCLDTWDQKCTYGVLAKDISKDVTVKRTLCTDTTTTSKAEEKDVRESISLSKDSDNLKYRWDYVITMAKLFDNVISNEYKFEPFYNYSVDNYNNFINKKDSYKNMTVDAFKTSEESKSKADSYSHQEEDYYDKQTKPVTSNTTWNGTNVVTSIPADAVLIANSATYAVVSQTEEIIKEGKEYEDVYVWNDKLNFESTKSGIYNVDSVKDVTGDDLTSSDIEYYQDLYTSKEINLIDLMNSDKNIYSNYLSTDEISSDTNNIGIRKSTLDVSYSVLEKDLKETLEKYPLNGIRYGASLGIDISSFATLSGLSFSDMENIAAGNMEGMNVAYPIATEELNNAYLYVLTKIGNSYGYAGHSGIDIAYAYNAADKSLCNDYSNSMCPYIKGPGIYSTMDGIIKEVGYSAWNKYYGEGQYVGNTTDGKMRISDTSGWGTYVKIENVDGSNAIYAHLFPDKDFFKQLSENIGQSVSAGTFIGFMGNTGNSSGLHLHIEFAQSMASLGGGRTGNSSLTYVYLMKIIDVMGINPRKG